MNTDKDINTAACSKILDDSERLEALNRTGMMKLGRTEAFDRLTRLAAKLLNVPITIVSFVGSEKQYFKSFYGLPEPWASHPEIPIDNSVCQYTLTGKVLALEDVRDHPLMADNPAVPALRLVGYLGVPLLTKGGQNLGAFCAIAQEPRKWSDSDIGTLVDLTTSIMSEIELSMSLDKLRKEEDRRHHFIAMLAHDLRTPLGIAQMSAEHIQLRSQESDTCREEAKRIERSMKSALALVDSFLDEKLSDLVRSQQLSMAEARLDIGLKRWVEDLNRVHRERFILRSAEVAVAAKVNLELLRRVVENLCNNAIKYGDPHAPVTIALTVNKAEETLELYVHNFGSVISDQEQREIFSPHHRTSEARSGSESGWGIGLAFVKEAVHLHKGEIKIVSDIDSGTEFKIILPLSRVDSLT